MTDKEWKKFKNLKDSEIDVSEIPELDEEFWKKARVVMPSSKTPISLRLDDEVLNWFKRQGRGYQSRINAVLRSYMENHLRGE